MSAQYACWKSFRPAMPPSTRLRKTFWILLGNLKKTEELERHYGFIGRDEHEWVSHLLRDDLPRDMWTWDVRRNVRAVARASAVLEKCGVKQRKLLMQVASNYLWTDPSLRGDVGLHGGGALS